MFLFCQTDGPELIGTITDQYVSETVGIIDEYVERVIDKIQYEVGFCAPLSTSYNATVVAICNEVDTSDLFLLLISISTGC